MRVATSGDPEARAGRRSRASTLLVQLLLVAATVLGCEAALQLGSAISTRFHGLLLPPWERHAPTLADRHLRGRGNPYNPEHDSAGYRNAGRPERTDIVVPGDSHSYGPTHASDGWAALLGQRLGVGVYNMALPGYGPGQSLLQLDEALSLHPRLVVVAPHFGNDFFDTFALSKLQPQLLKRLDPALIASAEAAEQRGPLEAEILRLYSLGEVAPTSVTGLRGWLSENIRLYGLLRAVAYRLRSDGAATGVLSSDFDHAVASLSDRQRSYAYPLELGDWRTIVTPSYRGRALDDSDPRIRIGFEAARNSLPAIAERCRSAGVPLLVLLMQTKETVFSHRVVDASRYPGLDERVSREARLRSELVQALVSQAVAYVDPLDALRNAVKQPYYPNVDGHPNEAGHAIVAAVVAERAGPKLRK